MMTLDTRSLMTQKDSSNTSSPINTVPRTRSQSISSDRPSIGYGGLLSPLTTVNPEPLYIAASAGSQIVTNDHDSHSEMWLDQHGIEPSGETALVANGALRLVNNFLDQILFNFLSLSRSTSLASLRPAVSEVLKPKLAKDAIALADQELHEYLGGGEEEELLAFHNGLEPSGDWDLELVWKRTRLRCMVYSSLGDMEEEDEDHYTELEQLDGPPGSNNRFSNNPGVVSPAVAIFLTSILEFMGEQVLVVAGQAAYHRLRAKHEREEREGTSGNVDIADRIVVDEMDMEKVALDRTLGRLWRGWKKRIRSPTPSMSIGRSFSRESLRSRGHSRINSVNGDRFAPVPEAPRKSSTTESLFHEHAASVPLPITADDVREIEIPGLVYHSDDEEDEEQSEDETPLRMRPKSLMLPGSMGHLSTLDTSEPHTPSLYPINRVRSNSLPSPGPSASASSSRTLGAITAGANATDVSNSKLEDNHDEQPTSNLSEKLATELDAPEHERGNVDEQQPKDNGGMMAGVLASAVAIGAVAVAGITAIAKGQAPETLQTPGEESDMEEAFIEEPQIMTASRASMHGRLTPDQVQAGSRPLSVRTQSIHSVRLVDVPSSQSPARSRHNSVGSMDHFTGVRATAMARSASEEGKRGTSPSSRVATSSPVIRQGSSLSQRQARNSTTESISELEERQAVPQKTFSAAPAAAAIPERSPLRETSSPILTAVPPFQRSDAEKSSVPVKSSVTRTREVTVPDKTTSNLPNGVPPLTPLSETTEGAIDSSDGPSVISKSKSEQNKTARGLGLDKVRVSPSQRQLDGETSPKTELNKSFRKIHTSSSSTSSGSNKLKPIRTSEDTLPSPSEDKNKAFEQLLQNDQTIQFTLTPQTMREIESPDSPRNPQPTVYNRGAERPRTNSSSSRLTALHSNPHTPSSPTHRSNGRPTANTGAKVRPGVGQARDARVDRDSVGDFAEFIRSTGPPGAILDDLTPRSAPAINGHRGQNGTIRNASATLPRSESLSGTPRRSQSSATRSRLQAREAVVPVSNNSSDLIDFIRQGPPSENSHNNPRIPRTVAPFRTTQDSDQMTGALGARVSELASEEPRISQTSTNNSTNDQSTRSMQSSVNSQSALLNTYNPKKLPSPNFNGFDDQDMMPKRKTRRVKDPYAIDFSDEEDDTFDTPPAKPIRQEESLIDFLNNVPPPAAPTTAQPFDFSKPVAKKTSAPSLMARFSRNSVSHGKPSGLSSSSGSSTYSSSNTSQSTHVPIPASKPTSHPSSSSGKLTKSASVSSSNYVSRLDSERKPTRVQQISYQPREPTSSRTSQRTATTDLADFLKNTPPPPMNGPQRLAVGGGGRVEAKEEGGFSRMFGRRKKVTAA